jgi:hypothetical protein
MSAAQLTRFELQQASSAPKVLERKAQIRCHLFCLRKQLLGLHFNRLPFHMLGIFRAIGS